MPECLVLISGDLFPAEELHHIDALLPDAAPLHSFRCGEYDNDRCDTRHNDTQYNDTQYNDTQDCDTWLHDTQYSDTQNDGLNMRLLAEHFTVVSCHLSEWVLSVIIQSCNMLSLKKTY